MLVWVTCFNKKCCAVVNSLNVSSDASHHVKFGFKWAWPVTTRMRHFLSFKKKKKKKKERQFRPKQSDQIVQMLTKCWKPNQISLALGLLGSSKELGWIDPSPSRAWVIKKELCYSNFFFTFFLQFFFFFFFLSFFCSFMPFLSALKIMGSSIEKKISK